MAETSAKSENPNVFFPFPLNRALGTWRSDALDIILKDERLLVSTQTYKQPNTLLNKYDQIHPFSLK